MMDHDAAGRALAEARRVGRKLEGYPCEAPDMAGALAIQDAMAAAMGAQVVGWKVGLTSRRAQEICGVNAPLAGPVFDGFIWESGAGIALVEGDLGIIEAEVGFRIGADLPPRAAGYGRDEVLAAVRGVLPVFEWVNKRLPGGIMEKAEWLTADGVINRGVVCGGELAYARAMDLKAEQVRVTVDGAEVTRGVGSAALGDPAEVLVWLANDLNARGKGLRAGDLVATGLICDVVQAVPGARVEAEFSTLGKVALSVEEG